MNKEDLETLNYLINQIPDKALANEIVKVLNRNYGNDNEEPA